MLALSKGHPLASEKTIPVSELEKEPFVCTDHESGLFAITRRICACGRFEPTVTISASDSDAVM